MNKLHIDVRRRARFYTSEQVSASTTHIVFVLHGYGQLAAPFLQSFEPLFHPGIVFAAPEALNRFYLKGGRDAVGATWMTKEDREHEIGDYLDYLNTLYEMTVPQSFEGKITALGFSQGASTVSRWVHSTPFRIDQTIIYAGEVAPELLPLADSSGLLKTQNHIIYGTNDAYFDRVSVEKLLSRYESLNAKVHEFNGKHEISCEMLSGLLQGC